MLDTNLLEVYKTSTTQDIKYLSKEEKQNIKQYILQNNIHKQAGELSLKDYRLFQRDINGVQYPSLNDYDYDNLIQERKAFISEHGALIVKMANNINHANYKRVQRIKKRIANIIEHNEAYFITITFNDNALSSTSEQTRRRYVSRWLKEYSNEYVANIDYGGRNGREHYHAVVKFNGISLPKDWPYGFIKVDKVRTSEADTKRVSKYISKLTNHAIKNTTKSKRILYSRPSK